MDELRLKELSISIIFMHLTNRLLLTSNVFIHARTILACYGINAIACPHKVQYNRNITLMTAAL